MANSNGRISRPVTQRDVQTVLGISSSVNKWSQLCTHADLNIWSKYRPKKYAARGIMDQYDFTNECWKADSVWWKGNNGNMCFTPYVTTNFANVIANTNGTLNGWGFDGVPNGGTYPYRIVDFIGYNHNALPMAADFSVPSEQEPQREFVVSCNIAMAGGDNVALGDFSTQLYFGFAFVNSNDTVVYHGTASTPLEAYVHITSFALTTYGNYRVFPFLCTEAITPTTGSMGNHTYWTIPNVSYTQCQVMQSTAGLVGTARWRYPSTPGQVVVTITNGGASAVSANIYVRRSGRNWGTSPQADEGDYANNPVTIPNDSPQEHWYTVNAGSNNYNYHAMVVVNGVKVIDTPVTNEEPIIE